jgi:opacity protein-like surface antigen
MLPAELFPGKVEKRGELPRTSAYGSAARRLACHATSAYDDPMTNRALRSRCAVPYLVLAGAAVVMAGPATAQTVDQEWYLTVYLQQSFPKQTNTNQQIDQINQMFGINFDTWDDVANLNLGVQLFRRVSPHWKLGLQVDYSQGKVDGSATVDTEAGPAELAFEQKYSAYADLYVTAHYLPCTTCQSFVPFLYGGIGVAYEKDTTHLTLKNDYIDEYLLVKNDGYFPSYSAGLGFDWYLSEKRLWYLELGGAYVWARMTNTVPAEGGLAPAPQVTADTDASGPNYWIGIGRRF